MPAIPGRVADSWAPGGGSGGTTVHDELTGRSEAGNHPLLIPLTQKGAANGVATLDAGSKIPAAQIPAIALSEFLGSVASEAAMLALDGQRGDWCIRTDLDPDSIFILETDDPTQAANWTNVTGLGVVSVDGQVGIVDLSGDYISAADLVDDDSFGTASPTTVPSSESTKVYVDSEVAGAVAASATVVADAVLASGTRTNAAYGALTVASAAVDVDVPANGNVMLLVGVDIACSLQTTSRVGVALTGANVAAAVDTASLRNETAVNLVNTKTGILIFTGLDPGLTTFTLEFKSASGTLTVSNQKVVAVVPLA